LCSIFEFDALRANGSDAAGGAGGIVVVSMSDLFDYVQHPT
jgi:hypothetical protein